MAAPQGGEPVHVRHHDRVCVQGVTCCHRAVAVAVVARLAPVRGVGERRDWGRKERGTRGVVGSEGGWIWRWRKADRRAGCLLHGRARGGPISAPPVVPGGIHAWEGGEYWQPLLRGYTRRSWVLLGWQGNACWGRWCDWPCLRRRCRGALVGWGELGGARGRGAEDVSWDVFVAGVRLFLFFLCVRLHAWRYAALSLLGGWVCRIAGRRVAACGHFLYPCAATAVARWCLSAWQGSRRAQGRAVSATGCPCQVGVVCRVGRTAPQGAVRPQKHTSPWGRRGTARSRATPQGVS